MPIVKLTLSDENYKRLKKMASEKSMSIQDFIKDKLLYEETIFTPEEAVKRAIDKFSDGREFSLPEVYGDDWKLERGKAGVFGKKFFNHIANVDTGIKYLRIDNITHRAIYKVDEINVNL